MISAQRQAQAVASSGKIDRPKSERYSRSVESALSAAARIALRSSLRYFPGATAKTRRKRSDLADFWRTRCCASRSVMRREEKKEYQR